MFFLDVLLLLRMDKFGPENKQHMVGHLVPPVLLVARSRSKNIVGPAEVTIMCLVALHCVALSA